MNQRLSRVEETIRRALADLLVRGELRDPRLRNAAAISITAVKISPDLGQAVVYVDVLGDAVSGDPASASPAAPHDALQRVIDGLNAGAHALRAKLGGRIRLKRTPALRFVVDRSIEQGRRIEAVLAELHAQEGGAAVSDSSVAAAPADDAADDDAADDDVADGDVADDDAADDDAADERDERGPGQDR
jgi:ribosome-binding factor A